MKNLKFITLLLIVIFPFVVFGQRGYSSAAMGMSQQKSAQMIIPQPDEIVVDEYLNYHTHKLPMPEGNLTVGLNVRWGNDMVSPSSDEAVLQVGFTTGLKEKYINSPAVNISLVIDKSGSMSQGGRLVKTKQAMTELVKQLRPKDFISIVEFDHVAKVVLPAQKVSNIAQIHQAISSIQLGGSTNMNDGIMLGYQEALKNANADHSSRVIILTDAIANTGEIDPEKMIANREGYNQEAEIDFALIGVGVDFNYQLSRQLTKNGKNQIHFINDAADIQKIFINEVEALLYPAAKNPYLEIEFGNDLELVQFYGYEPTITDEKIQLNLNNMNAGLTQVVLAKFKVKNGKKKFLPVQVNLHYFDAQKNKEVSQSIKTRLQVDNSWKQYDMFIDADIEKNYRIAQMAQDLKVMANYYNSNQPFAAKGHLSLAIDNIKKEYPNPTDKDFLKMLGILENYMGRLNTLLAKR